MNGNHDVVIEVLSWLEPREIGRAAVISRMYHKADRTPLLWFHVYSRLFRGHLPAPPRFDAIRRGAATAASCAAPSSGRTSRATASARRTTAAGWGTGEAG